ncbi:MAG: hypothetical protein MUC67_01300 [Acidobacteria bacterium]|nr:hypothetical protein [Acidobacteriota bacterium]
MRRLGQVPGVPAAALAPGLDDPDPLVRGCTVQALLHLDPDDVGARLLGTSGDWNAERTLLAGELAGRVRALPLRTALAERACAAAAAERDALGRAQAASACVRVLGPDRAADFIRDPDWTVRARVAGALTELPPTTERQDALAKLAEDPHPTVRGLVARAG